MTSHPMYMEMQEPSLHWKWQASWRERLYTSSCVHQTCYLATTVNRVGRTACKSTESYRTQFACFHTDGPARYYTRPRSSCPSDRPARVSSAECTWRALFPCGWAKDDTRTVSYCRLQLRHPTVSSRLLASGCLLGTLWWTRERDATAGASVPRMAAMLSSSSLSSHWLFQSPPLSRPWCNAGRCSSVCVGAWCWAWHGRPMQRSQTPCRGEGTTWSEQWKWIIRQGNSCSSSHCTCKGSSRKFTK